MRPRVHVADDLDEDTTIDFQAAKQRALLVLRSPLRHLKVALAVFLATVALSGFVALRAKPVYRAQTDIIVQRNVMMPTFGETARNQQNTDFDPVTGVSETVKGRDNLLALVRETHLAERTTQGGRSGASDDKIQLLAKALESKLSVKTDGVIVTFTVDWSDPQIAYDLVSAAVHNFLDGRNAAEVSLISSAITLLEQHAESEREGIDEAMNEFLRLKEGWNAPVPAVGGGIARPALVRPVIDSDVPRRIAEKRQQIKDLEDERRKQMTELRGQMAGLLGSYTPSHPAVAALQRKIDAIADEPSSLAALKNEERAMLNQVASSFGGKVQAKSVGGFVMPELPRIAPVGRGASVAPFSRQDLEIADPASAVALSRLQNRIHKYEEFMDQISAAKLELDLARNAFQYRYGINRPAEVPTKPKFPLRTLALVAGALFGLVLTVVVTAILDLLGGRFLEPWQVKRKLDLPLLGEVTRP
jgi:uncharacterized protein involved in exopolysaccharide biosynthesis